MLRNDLKSAGKDIVNVYWDIVDEKLILEVLDRESRMRYNKERYIEQAISKEDALELAIGILEALD